MEHAPQWFAHKLLDNKLHCLKQSTDNVTYKFFLYEHAPDS